MSTITTGAGEPAARWFRVSTGDQQEQHQFTKVDRHCAERGYDVRKTFTLHGDSAYHGEQEPELRQVLADITAGEYSVVVVRHSDRLDRRDPKIAMMYALSIQLAGGRVESVEEPAYGTDDELGFISTSLSVIKNHRESKDKSERVLDAFATIAANGAFRGSVPWGLTVTGPELNKHLVVTDNGAGYLPQIFTRIEAGSSLLDVARWLTTQRVPRSDERYMTDGRPGPLRPWYPQAVDSIVKNPCYKGHYCEREPGGHGTRGRYGKVIYKWAGIVSPSLWDRANASLSGRVQRRGGPPARGEGEPLSGAVRCWHCAQRGIDSPVYRHSSHGRRWLTCAGRGAQRRGCGFRLPLDIATPLADEVLGGRLNPVYAITFVPGNEAELADRRARLDMERRQVALKGLSWDDEDRERDRLRAEYAKLDREKVIPDRRELTPTGETEGRRWQRLDSGERARYLRSGEFQAQIGRAGDMDRPDGTRDGFGLELVYTDDDEVPDAR